MISQETQVFDYLDTMNDLAVALNIQDPVSIIQHQYEVYSQTRKNIDEDKKMMYDFQTIDTVFQAQAAKKKENLWHKVDKEVLGQLGLIEFYQKFQEFKRNGATTADLQELRCALVQALQQQMK